MSSDFTELSSRPLNGPYQLALAQPPSSTMAHLSDLDDKILRRIVNHLELFDQLTFAGLNRRLYKLLLWKIIDVSHKNALFPTPPQPDPHPYRLLNWDSRYRHWMLNYMSCCGFALCLRCQCWFKSGTDHVAYCPYRGELDDNRVLDERTQLEVYRKELQERRAGLTLADVKKIDERRRREKSGKMLDESTDPNYKAVKLGDVEELGDIKELKERKEREDLERRRERYVIEHGKDRNEHDLHRVLKLSDPKELLRRRVLDQARMRAERKDSHTAQELGFRISAPSPPMRDLAAASTADFRASAGLPPLMDLTAPHGPKPSRDLFRSLEEMKKMDEYMNKKRFGKAKKEVKKDEKEACKELIDLDDLDDFDDDNWELLSRGAPESEDWELLSRAGEEADKSQQEVQQDHGSSS